MKYICDVCGWEYDEDRRKAQEAGMDGFLAKPLDVDEMMRLLAQIIKTE